MATILDDRDVVAIELPGGVILLARLGHPRLSRLPRIDAGGAASAVAGAPRYDHAVGRMGTRAVSDLRRLLEKSHTPIRPFLPAAEGCAEAAERALRSGALIGVRLTAFDLGKLDPEAKIDASNLPASMTDRIAELLRRTPKHLSDYLAAAFAKLISVEALAALAAAFAILLAAQFFGVGEIADAALAWWAYIQAGLSGVHGLYEALRAVVQAVRAKDDASFDDAIRRFADGVALVGVALLTAVLTKVAREQRARSEDAPAPTSAKLPGGTAGNRPPRPLNRSASPSRTAGFGDDAKIEDHFNRHGSDFGAADAGECQQQANTFLNGPAGSNVLEKTRPNGDIVPFDKTTQEFGSPKRMERSGHATCPILRCMAFQPIWITSMPKNEVTSVCPVCGYPGLFEPA